MNNLQKYFDPIVSTSLARLEETMQLISLPTLFATKIRWMVNKMGKKVKQRFILIKKVI